MAAHSPPYLGPHSRPSYKNGLIARYAGESLYPELWRGLVGAWMPGMGHSGDTLFDLSGRGRHGILGGSTKGVSTWPGWIMRPGGHVIKTVGSGSGSLQHIAVGNWNITTGRITIVVKVSREGFTGEPADLRIVAKGFNTGEHLFMLGSLSNTSFRTRFRVDGTTHTDVTTNIFDEDRERFLAGRFDGVNISHIHHRFDSGDDRAKQIIVDFATTGTLDTDANNIEIARQPGSDPYGNWDGYIYFVYIYDRALRDAELMTLFKDNYAPFRMRPRIFKAPAVVSGKVPIFMRTYRQRRVA